MAQRADAPERVTTWFRERFGLSPSVFSNHLLLRAGHSYWAIRRSDHVAAMLRFARVEYFGVRLLRRVGRYLKPTTYALQRFAADARKNVIGLSRDDFSQVLGSDEGLAGPFDAEPGYVILKRGDDVLGCGLWLGGRLTHCFPKGRGDALRTSGLY